MLIGGQVPKNLWTEAAQSAVKFINFSPTKANLGLTPDEQFYSVKPDLSQLRIFGCLAHVHIRKDLRNKLEPRSETRIYLGTDEESKGYRIFIPSSKKVIITKDVIFDENRFYKTDPVDTTFEYISLSSLFTSSFPTEDEVNEPEETNKPSSSISPHSDIAQPDPVNRISCMMMTPTPLVDPHPHKSLREILCHINPSWTILKNGPQ
jgi:hypothetical protein